jgi:hypothetical protein
MPGWLRFDDAYEPSEASMRRPSDPVGVGGIVSLPLVGGRGVSAERSEADDGASGASGIGLGSYRLIVKNEF